MQRVVATPARHPNNNSKRAVARPFTTRRQSKRKRRRERRRRSRRVVVLAQPMILPECRWIQTQTTPAFQAMVKMPQTMPKKRRQLSSPSGKSTAAAATKMGRVATVGVEEVVEEERLC
jgi:hypothetical protein